MYRPLGEMVYERYNDLKDGNKHKQAFFDSFKKPINMKHMKGFMQAFDKYDKNHNGRLNFREWMTLNKEVEKFVNKGLGSAGPHWNFGERRLFWTLTDAVSNGRWNRGHIRRGRGNITKRDMMRLTRIMRRVYKRVDKDAAEDRKADKKMEEFLL